MRPIIIPTLRSQNKKEQNETKRLNGLKVKLIKSILYKFVVLCIENLWRNTLVFLSGGSIHVCIIRICFKSFDLFRRGCNPLVASLSDHS